MSSQLRVLAAATAVLFITSCIPDVTQPMNARYWDDREVPTEAEQENPERDRCVENCG